ncbi:hypothetical protein A3715_03485 [Oleiphilus sp. HI0009]|nr:hypothetical protein A3715_03485 [Oleiphilus sp. HI0009]KZY71544.1 hypothetical protein A3738_14690 [Oleiphilus sp. HI0066]
MLIGSPMTALRGIHYQTELPLSQQSQKSIIRFYIAVHFETLKNLKHTRSPSLKIFDIQD